MSSTRDLSGARALTLWEPWATLLVSGVKHVETRDWDTAYRGPLLITASKPSSESRRVFQAQMNEPMTVRALEAAGVWPVQGPALVGVVDLASTFRMGRKTPPVSELEQHLGNWTPGRFAWHVTNPVRFASQVACRGRQGLWVPERELLLEAVRNLRMLAAPRQCAVCSLPQDPFERGAWERFCLGCDRWLCADHVFGRDAAVPSGPHDGGAHAALEYGAKVLPFPAAGLEA